ncbi:hepcidin-like [Eleginops maclovinus]|uniref:hepcidin-like n=1 Tax=Eleginops maclovinus TaxID=56733 RepID=UPI003080B517
MKTFCVAVAVVLTFICIQESAAVPGPEVEELDEPMSYDNAVTEHEERSEDLWKIPYNIREKRGIKCKFCCNCCSHSVCGLCCRKRFG